MRSVVALVASLVAGAASAVVPVQSRLVSEVRVYGPIAQEKAKATTEAEVKGLCGEGRRAEGRTCRRMIKCASVGALPDFKLYNDKS